MDQKIARIRHSSRSVASRRVRAGWPLRCTVSIAGTADAAALHAFDQHRDHVSRAEASPADRIRAVAAQGFKAYSFWSASPDDRKAMVQAQKETGLTCVSIVGTGPSGGSTDSRARAADKLLAEIRERVAIAKDFGTPDLISFVGQIQNDVPWDEQRAGIVDGLKRAGDIAAAGDVTITIEPLSVEPGQPRRRSTARLIVSR